MAVHILRPTHTHTYVNAPARMQSAAAEAPSPVEAALAQGENATSYWDPEAGSYLRDKASYIIGFAVVGAVVLAIFVAFFIARIVCCTCRSKVRLHCSA